MNAPVIPGRDVAASNDPVWDRAKTSRLVFALNADSVNRFRPGFEPDSFPGVDVRWLEPGELGGNAFSEALREANPEVLVTGWNSPRIPESYLPEGECALRYICHLAGTVKTFIPRSLIEKGVSVTNWGTSISHTVAEHAVLLVLAALRGMPQWDRYMADWPRRRALPSRRLRGKRVGLHGFGAIARELAAMLRPFGVTLCAYSLGVPARIFLEHGVQPAEDLDSLFSNSDIVIECEALTPATDGVVSERLLRLLPPEAVFVNVGRSRIVDEDALARVAVERGLRLGLDVFNDEPPPADMPLRHVPDAILSPHIAGPTPDAFPVLWDYAMQNIARYYAGEDLVGLVTLEVYERST